MEEKNKKVIVLTIIAVVTLVILTVGATYAYFRVATDNNFGTPKIEASTPSIGSVALSTGSNLTMNLTAEQMMQQIDYWYEDLQACIEEAEQEGDTPENWGCYDYEIKSALYFASSNGTTKELSTENIGTATVAGEGLYNCTYTLTVDDNANSLYDKFQTYTNKSTGQIVLSVNDIDYDFNTENLFPLKIDGNMRNVSENSPKNITAQLRLVNDGNLDQSNLAGQNITLTFEVENFSCTSVEKPSELCIRATKLHESLKRGNIIYDDLKYERYGNLGTAGADLVSGDALTCDVNGDGTYDEETERFYYVSDYYNTTTKEFESDKATLIYYVNTSDRTAYYKLAEENWHGPVTAITALPTTSEWTNVSLINSQRAILNEEAGNAVTYRGTTYDLPTNFDYSGYSARLLTYQEADYFINNCNGYGCMIGGGNSGFKLETVRSTFNYLNWSLDFRDNLSYLSGNVIVIGGIRPVIEVYKTDIDN